MPRLNPRDMISMTYQEKWKLEAKSKQGWKCYFIERERMYDLQDTREDTRDTALQLMNNERVDYEYLKNMFLTLYEKVGELCDCPICLETLTKEKTFVPLCGHLVCNDCKSRINSCPICRKKFN